VGSHCGDEAPNICHFCHFYQGVSFGPGTPRLLRPHARLALRVVRLTSHISEETIESLTRRWRIQLAMEDSIEFLRFILSDGALNASSNSWAG
jgi:hypothetical protein